MYVCVVILFVRTRDLIFEEFAVFLEQKKKMRTDRKYRVDIERNYIVFIFYSFETRTTAIRPK